MIRYTHKIVRTMKPFPCYLCRTDIPARSFVVQRDQRMEYLGHRPMYPGPSERAHLTCFDYEHNKGSGLEPVLGGKSVS